jgi:hypothetical protein
MVRILGLVGLSLLFTTIIYAQSVPSVRDCDGKLLSDINVDAVDDHTKADFFSLVTAQNYSAASHGASATYGAFQGSYNDFSTNTSSTTDVKKSSLDSAHAASHLTQHLTAIGLAAYQSCLQTVANSQVGLYAWETNSNDIQVSFKVYWHNPPVAKNVIGNVSIQGVTDDASKQFLQPGQDVGSNFSHTYSLKRISSGAEVDVNFDIDGFPVQLISLPSVTRTGVVPGQILQRIVKDLPHSAQCTDPDNKDNILCDWWDVTVHPVSRRSHWVVNAKVSFKIMRVADKGDPAEHSAGTVTLMCNSKQADKKRVFATHTESLPFADIGLYGVCPAEGETRIQVTANPRGVSGMFVPPDTPDPYPDFLLIEEISD